MTTLPLIRHTDTDTEVGFSEDLTADTDAVLTVPDGALGCVLWFEDADGNMIGGRIGVDQAADLVAEITDTNMGWHPPMPVEYTLLGYSQSGQTYRYRDNYVHLAVATGTSVPAMVYGEWGFALDTNE